NSLYFPECYYIFAQLIHSFKIAIATCFRESTEPASILQSEADLGPTFRDIQQLNRLELLEWNLLTAFQLDVWLHVKLKIPFSHHCQTSTEWADLCHWLRRNLFLRNRRLSIHMSGSGFRCRNRRRACRLRSGSSDYAGLMQSNQQAGQSS